MHNIQLECFSYPPYLFYFCKLPLFLLLLFKCSKSCGLFTLSFFFLLLSLTRLIFCPLLLDRSTNFLIEVR